MTGSDETAASTDQRRRVLATTLTFSGIATIAVAIALGIAVEPFLFAIALVGVADIVLARMFASGRLGGGSADAGDAATVTAADPSYNPYARED